MPAKSQPEVEAPVFPESFSQLNAKTLEAVSAFAQANQRVVGELIEFSSAAAKESLRTYAEIQSVAVEAARTAPVAPIGPREAIEELRQDPFAWYRKGVQTAVDGTEKAFKVLGTNAQIVTRSAERLQASAERSGKEIQEALTAYMNRMQEIYGRN